MGKLNESESRPFLRFLAAQSDFLGGRGERGASWSKGVGGRLFILFPPYPLPSLRPPTRKREERRGNRTEILTGRKRGGGGILKAAKKMEHCTADEQRFSAQSRGFAPSLFFSLPASSSSPPPRPWRRKNVARGKQWRNSL